MIQSIDLFNIQIPQGVVIDSIFIAVGKQARVNPADIMSKNRSGQLPSLRAIISHILYYQFCLSQPEIASVFRTDHSTIIHHLNTIDSAIEIQKKVKGNSILEQNLVMLYNAVNNMSKHGDIATLCTEYKGDGELNNYPKYHYDYEERRGQKAKMLRSRASFEHKN